MKIVSISNPITRDLDNTIWLNFHHSKDLISGKLDAYKVDKNTNCEEEIMESDKEIPCKEKTLGFREAHYCYWGCQKFYEDIAAKFFQ